MSERDLESPEIETIERDGISKVWIVPIIAVLVGGFVWWKSVSEQGPLVEIHFSQGHGITAGKTEVRYADVAVGIVESVSLSENLEEVIVEARLKPFMEPFVGDTTEFWVVTANLRGSSLSGLSTILSGAYIEAGWASPPEKSQRVFQGLDERPLTPPGADGSHFSIRANSAGSVNVGSPVFYRRVRVGQIEAMQMDQEFQFVNYTVFVEAPFDRLLNTTTRFWNTSGLTVNAGFDGFKVEFASVESLLAGGVSFGNIGRTIGTSDLDLARPFRLYPSREAAIEAGFEAPEGEGQLFMASFDESIRGLEAGAPVEWQGIRVGRVRDVVLNLGDPSTDVREIYAVIEMQPDRVGLDGFSDDALREGMNRWLREGMRAQLAAGNMLTGRKLIRLIDGAAKPNENFEIDFDAKPYPVLPTIPATNLGEVTQNVEDIVANIAALPLDQLVGSIIELVDNADAIIGNPDLAGVPGQLSDVLGAFDSAMGNVDSAAANLPQLVVSLIEVVVAGERTLAGLSPESEMYVELSGAMNELRDATRAMSELAQTLEDKPNALLLGR